MAELLQIILINLVVSCDNVGVIALTTRRLPQEKAKTAQRLGIGLSLLLKLLFIFFTSYLFGLPWLHIRILGGIMLLYVTWNMLRQEGHSSHPAVRENDSFLFAMISIVAADISMSLDNVIAVLSIVSSDGEAISTGDFLKILVGLVVCVPLLLWFSKTISRLMEKYPVLVYLCAGYLVYIAMGMICEDETIALFLQSIHFTFTKPAALLCGLLVVVFSLFVRGGRTPVQTKRRKGLIPIYIVAAGYSFIMIGIISYLNTNPIVDGHRVSVEMLYGFTPSGAGAIYLLGVSPFLFALCAMVIVIILMGKQPYGKNPRDYLRETAHCVAAVAVFILINLLFCTIGLTVTFGFGRFHSPTYFTCLFIQLLLYSTYTCIFSMTRTIAKSRMVSVALCILFVLFENILMEILIFRKNWAVGFLPDYYITTLPEQNVNGGLVLRVAVTAFLLIVISTWIGYEHCKRSHPIVSGKKLSIS